MIVQLLAMAALLGLTPPAVAGQFYKCTSNGSVTYQNTPCAVEEKRRQPTVDELNAERRKMLAQESASPSAPQAAAGLPRPDPGVSDTGAAATRRAAAPPSGFKCDARTHCSQMRSCAEATYFLANCPGVQMDGNRDGVPCEQQWCRR